jgi:hypothetical protein
VRRLLGGCLRSGMPQQCVCVLLSESRAHHSWHEPGGLEAAWAWCVLRQRVRCWQACAALAADRRVLPSLLTGVCCPRCRYRAKFITGSVAALLARPEGGLQWLTRLRQASYEEASEALCTLPGVWLGPPVRHRHAHRHVHMPTEPSLWTAPRYRLLTC